MLSSIILPQLTEARIKAQRAKALLEMKQISTMSVIAQGEAGSRVRDILPGADDPVGTPDKDTYDWPDGPCYPINRVDPDLRNIPGTDPCYENWIDVVTRIQTATNGIVANVENMKRDPWGSPYLFDPNEGEPSPPDFPGRCDRHDSIRSAGPDGISNWVDDIFFLVPFSGYMFDTDGDLVPDMSCG